jgi:hypothetical protein
VSKEKVMFLAAPPRDQNSKNNGVLLRRQVKSKNIGVSKEKVMFLASPP